jgi:hypothetical protein
MEGTIAWNEHLSYLFIGQVLLVIAFQELNSPSVFLFISVCVILDAQNLVKN